MPHAPSPSVFVYSKTGHSRRVAIALADMLGAELITLETRRYKMPVLWMARAVFDAFRGVAPPIQPEDTGARQRPWTVLVGPIWVGRLAPPLRTALMSMANGTQGVGLLTTSGDPSPPEGVHAAARTILGRDLIAVANVDNALEGSPAVADRLATFAARFRDQIGQGAA